MRSANNLRQLNIAMFLYAVEHDDHLPPAAVLSKEGEPLLSWRVLILPYLDHADLFKRFRLDEPWDSPHNYPLLKEMPSIYAPVGVGDVEPYATFCQVFVGKGTLFEQGKEIDWKMIDQADGLTNTITVVEAATAVPWTKPADLPYETDKSLPELGYIRIRDGWLDFRRSKKPGFNAAFADSSLKFLRPSLDPQILRFMITWQDGRPIPGDF